MRCTTSITSTSSASGQTSARREGSVRWADVGRQYGEGFGTVAAATGGCVGDVRNRWKVNAVGRSGEEECGRGNGGGNRGLSTLRQTGIAVSVVSPPSDNDTPSDSTTTHTPPATLSKPHVKRRPRLCGVRCPSGRTGFVMVRWGQPRRCHLRLSDASEARERKMLRTSEAGRRISGSRSSASRVSHVLRLCEKSANYPLHRQRRRNPSVVKTSIGHIISSWTHHI